MMNTKRQVSFNSSFRTHHLEFVMAKKDKAAVRKAVRTRIRRRVRGTAERPRLAIFRSLNHIYAQLIDDERAVTIASASSVEKDLRGATGGNVEAARRVGQAIAERAREKGIETVVFDRGGFRYHGRVKALADAEIGRASCRERG